MTKKLALNLDQSKRVRKAFGNFEIVKGTWAKKLFLKTFRPIFDWSKNRFDRSKITFDWSSTNRAKQIQTKFLIAISIGRETSSIDWNSGKKKKNEKKESILMQKLLKAQYIMNRMHEYKMKCFSKTLVLNPDLPKVRFLINISLNLKHQIHFALKSRNFQSWMATTKLHTITCTKFSKE